MKKLFLKKGKELSVSRGHPWIFSGAISGKSDQLEEGDLAQVCDYKDRVLGSGFFQEGRIALKLLTFGSQKLDHGVFERKIVNASEYRFRMGFPGERTNAYRLVNGEADLLPGIIIDIYHETAVAHFYLKGTAPYHDDIGTILLNLNQGKIKYVLFKVRGHGGQWDYEWFGETGPNESTIHEDGIQYNVDVLEGQKTGFFLDQRHNRALLSDMSSGKVVLNTFAYTGGFSLAAFKGGAKRVVSVEISKTATDAISRHIEVNQFNGASHQNVNGDVFKYLSDTNEKYDIIVLDPPAFAKSIHKRHNAVIAYKRLNAMAMKTLDSGGLLWTFSCSQVVNRALFEDTIRAAALEAGKKLRLVKRLGQPEDHPVALHVPETEYLKGLVLEII